MATAAQSEGQRVFLRKASGLIRTASGLDVFVFNIGLISVGLGVGTIMLYGPAFYPGGDVLGATTFAAVVMLFCVWGFVTWTVAIPRSGGSYVFASRIWPPSVAFTLSFTECLVLIFYGAVAAYWVVLIGISPMLSIAGAISGSEGLTNASVTVIQPLPMFLIGSGLLIVAGALLASGMRHYLLSQKVVFTIAMLGSLLVIILLAAGSRETFIANLNTLFASTMGVDDVYAATISSAKENGWGYENGNLSTSIKLANFAFLPFVGAFLSIFIGGEIKAAAKAQTLGMVGALVAAVAVWAVTIVLALNVFGYDFIGAAAYNFLGIYVFGFLESGVTTPIDPSINGLTGVLTNSTAVAWLVSIGFIAWIWMWIPAALTCGIRGMVAWSLDRLAPEAFAVVSPKRHTPTVSIGIATALGVIFMACLAFTTYASTIVLLFEATVLAWCVTLIGGVFFPYRRRDLYERSPLATKNIFGLPMMSVACGLGFIGMAFLLYNLIVDPVAAGHDPIQLGIVGAVILAGLVFYLTMKAIRRAQGIDITAAFREIPVE